MREMIRKSISAVVLASICWLGIPLAFGAMQTRPMDRNRVVGSRALDHSRCPSLDPRTVLVAIYPPVMPCGEPHPCCARRSPSPPPNASAKGNLIRPAAEPILIISPEKPPRAGRRTVKTSADLFLPAPFERGTVLRN